jgi:guanylate kinase
MRGESGELFILSAPSGAGKTTLIRGVMSSLTEFGRPVFSVSHTTRKPRQGEIDGTDYHFIDPESFQRMIDQDRFLEWARVHSHCYGTALEEVFPRLEQGTDVVLDIDVQGAEKVLARCPEAHSIFIMPPGYADLRSRLHGRGLDGEEEIARRLAAAVEEMHRYDRYHYVIVNDDARRASSVLAAIILEKRYKRERMRSRIQDILNDFQDRNSV